MAYEMFNYPITANFGHAGNSHPVPHTGVDIATPVGVKVQALFTGEVTKILHNDPILGNAVYLTSLSGEQLEYGHLSRIMTYEGQKVLEGHVLGLTGDTGRVTGAHLHISLLDKEEIPLDITVPTASSLTDKISNAVSDAIGGQLEKIIDLLQNFGYLLLDGFKTIIILYMIWCCYCFMMKFKRIGLPPFADVRPIDAFAFNGMFLCIISIAQAAIR